MSVVGSRGEKRHVCPRCNGEGLIANPAFDGMSVSEMVERDGYEETDEFLREYTKRGGMYDIVCPCCRGNKVINIARLQEWNEEEEYRREEEAERRMLGMGRY